MKLIPRILFRTHFFSINLFVVLFVFLSLTGCKKDDGTFDNVAQDPIIKDTIVEPEPGDGSFLLSASHRVSAKMPMHLVYPRPDSETQEHARHRWAHSEMDYEIPIGVQGGAWPFKYEIIEGPSSASIGEIYGSTNYGNIKWSSPTSGAHHFSIKITDQEMNTITADWDVVVDDSKFVFIQDGYAGNKSGTISEPLEDIEDWYKNDRNDNTYHNKIIVFRAGNYFVKGDSDANNNLRLDVGSKTPSLIAFPDEIPILDSSQSKIFTDEGSLKDVFVAGIQFKDGRQDVNNAHFFWAVGDVSRSTWWKNHFNNLGPGQVGNDNTTPVFISSTTGIKENILYSQNLFDQINTVGTNGSYFDIYHSNYVLIERNIAKNSNTNYGWWVKRGDSYVSIRANIASENVQGNQITIGYSGPIPHDNEVSWNYIKANVSNNDSSLLWAGSTANQGATYNSYIYRNTFVGGSAWVRFPGNENYEVDGNIVMSDLLARWNTDIMTTTTENLTGSADSNMVDDNGKLQGSSKEQYYGTHGYEVPPPHE